MTNDSQNTGSGAPAVTHTASGNAINLTFDVSDLFFTLPNHLDDSTKDSILLLLTPPKKTGNGRPLLKNNGGKYVLAAAIMFGKTFDKKRFEDAARIKIKAIALQLGIKDQMPINQAVELYTDYAERYFNLCEEISAIFTSHLPDVFATKVAATKKNCDTRDKRAKTLYNIMKRALSERASRQQNLAYFTATPLNLEQVATTVTTGVVGRYANGVGSYKLRAGVSGSAGVAPSSVFDNSDTPNKDLISAVRSYVKGKLATQVIKSGNTDKTTVNCTYLGIYEAIRRNIKPVGAHPESLAAQIILDALDVFLIKNSNAVAEGKTFTILDTCAGWGDRAVAAAAVAKHIQTTHPGLQVEYIGRDPAAGDDKQNAFYQQLLVRLRDDVENFTGWITDGCAEDPGSYQSGRVATYDCFLTSPPYWVPKSNTQGSYKHAELYPANPDKQVHTLYKTQEAYYQFFKTMISHTLFMLKEGATGAINVPATRLYLDAIQEVLATFNCTLAKVVLFKPSGKVFAPDATSDTLPAEAYFTFTRGAIGQLPNGSEAPHPMSAADIAYRHFVAATSGQAPPATAPASSQPSGFGGSQHSLFAQSQPDKRPRADADADADADANEPRQKRARY